VIGGLEEGVVVAFCGASGATAPVACPTACVPAKHTSTISNEILVISS
jgi:hypothetical protein